LAQGRGSAAGRFAEDLVLFGQGDRLRLSRPDGPNTLNTSGSLKQTSPPAQPSEESTCSQQNERCGLWNGIHREVVYASSSRGSAGHGVNVGNPKEDRGSVV
jgi:hypothetical protein